MNGNEFTLSIIAALNKQLSRQQIKKDLKTLDNSLYVKIISKLAITLSRKQLNKDLKRLNDLYLQIGAGIKTDKNAKQRLQAQIRQLQQNLEELQLKVGVKKADSSNVKKSVYSSIKEAQQYAEGNRIRLDVEVRKEKAVNDILYIGKKYSKLFSNVAATQKYENLLASSCSISDEGQLKSVRNQISAFTSELRANGLATESTGAKWQKLINRAKELFSAATVVSTIFTQVKQSVSTFLQLDTAMTNLYKVQNDITSRDRFSGLLAKWNRLAQSLAVTTESLISSMEAWSKIGFDLDMSEQLAQITAVFEKTAEISNEKATSTLISAAQAFTEIDDLGVDDYVERVEAVGNKINAIGNKYAIDSEGIADGLQNASAALKVAGNDLNETISLITATNKIYQSPEEGANMLKVASMRLRGQVDALQEMGEDAEGVSADITKIQQQIYELTGNKVNIFEDEDTLKSTYRIILEIGEVFDSLNDRQQADLLEKMFGKQRSGAGAALLLNYEELEKIKNDSMNAAGSMAEEYGKYMESAEAHITIFREKLTEAYSAFMSGDLIKYMADAGSGILDIVNATDLLKHSILAITALGIGKGIASVGASIAATAKEYGTLGNALQQVKSLPIDEILRKDVLDDVGESTKLLTEKNLKLLLSQKQLEDSDKIRILRKHDLTKTQAKAKLEKLGLITVTKAQSAANMEETATTFILGGAVTSLKVKMASLGATMKAFFLSNPVTVTLTILTTAFSIFTTIMSKVKQSSEKAAEAFENAKSTAQKFKDSISDIRSETQKTAKDAKEITEAYAKLAQGVNTSTNANISLTNKDYEEFLDLNNQLAKLFPQLTKGYDENGNAILDLGGSVESITGKIAALAEQQERLSKIEIRKNIESYVNGDGKDGGQLKVIEGLEENLTEAEKELNDFEAKFDAIINGRKVNEDFLTGNAKEAAKDFYKEAFGLTEEELEAASVINRNIFGEGVYRFDFGKLEIDESRKQEILESYNSFYKQLHDDVLYAQSELQIANSELSSMMLLWTEGEFTYLNNDEEVQNLIRHMVGNIDWNTLDVSSFAEAKQWIQDNILRKINSISKDDKAKIAEAINGLFTTDLSALSPQQAKELVDQYIKSIVKVLGEDKLELKICLGFEDVDTIAHNYNAVMQKAAEKFSGVNGVRNKENWNNPDSFIDYESEKAALEAFAEENSINTQDEIAFWNQCIEESETKEEAMKKYLASKFAGNVEEPIIPDIIASVSAIATQLEPQFAKLGEAYKAIFTEDGFTLDAVDNSMLESLRKSFAEIGEEIGVTFDPVQIEPFFAVLTDGNSTADDVQRAFNDLATAYLYSTGTLEQLNNETANAIEKQLAQMGVTNAEAIVAEALSLKNEELALSKKYLAQEGKELVNATDSEVLAFMAEQAEAGNCGSALAALQLQKLLVNGTLLDTETDINNVMKLAQSAGITTEALSRLITLKAAYKEAEEKGNFMTASNIALVMGKLEQDFRDEVNNFELNPIDIEFKAPDSGKSSASSSASKQAETDWKALLDKETNLLEKQLAANVITFREYTDKRRQIIEDYYRDGRIKAEEYCDALESMYANQLSLHDRAVNAVTGRLDEEIDRLKEQKEALESSYQVRIDAIQEEIDALNKANDARKEQIDLEKAQYEAERARKQRVNRSFDGSQFIYEADAEAVRDAEDDLADKEFQLNISRLETQIESLRAEMENAAKSLDIQVEALESYKEKWNEIADSYGEQQDKLIAAEIMGTEWERDILNGRLDTLRSFTEQYIALQQAQADAAVNAARIKAEAGNGNTAGGNVGSVNTVGNVGNAGTGGNGNDDDDTQKYDVVYEGTAKAVRTFNTPEEAQSYANYMNKVHYKDDFMYYVKKYASGTNHAKKGLNLVGEEGTETFIDNDGNISLVTKPTLIPMEGGEVVKNAEETKELLDTSNLEPVQSEGMKKLYGYVKNLDVAKLDFHKIMQPFGNMVQIPSFHYAPVMNHFVSEPAPVVQHITLTLPNVTNNSGADYIMKELRRLPLDAYQHSHRRNR